jgi:glycosyltransferase involved in cell wall biosynthesis
VSVRAKRHSEGDGAPAAVGDPRVSVLMAVHNGERFLREALDCLLAQTLEDFELVVVDDGSTDGTGAILASYAARDRRLVVVRNEGNLRLPASLNRGLEHCRASLVARADADDVYHPERLERQVAFMEAHPEVGVASCAYQRTDAQGRIIGTVRPPTDDGVIRFRQLFINGFLHPGVVFRVSLVRAVGGYDTDYWTAQDSDLWARVRDRTRLANLPEPLVRYRVHTSSTMRTRGGEGRTLSLSVPRRLLSAYLERSLSLEEAEAIVTLYQGFEWMESNAIARGRQGLRDVLQRARRREAPGVVRYFKREVGRSLAKQARYQGGSHRSLSRALFAEALWWSPRLVRSSEIIKQAVRLTVPGTAWDSLRALLKAS